MGFEQLAELKKQLDASTATELPKPAKKPSAHQKKSVAPVDPVVLTIGRLQKLFPQAFPKNPLPKVPLKIGIFDDLSAKSEAIGISVEELQLAVKTWCNSRRYWASLVENAPRIDLEGNASGLVLANAAKQARFFENRQLRSRKAKEAVAPEDGS